MTDLTTGDLLVARFSPMNVAKLTEAAVDEADACRAEGRPVLYSVSTFALLKARDDDTIDALLERICLEAPVGGKNVWVTTRTDLQGAGFELHSSQPPLHHYDVVLGQTLRTADVERLFAVLDPGKRRNPAWKR